MNTLGKRIKEARGKITQQSLSSQIVIAQNSLSRYERDEKTPDANFLALFCKKLNISPYWLLFGHGPMCGNEQPSGFIDDKRLTEAIRIVEQGLAETNRIMLPENKAKLITAIYDFLLDEKQINTEKVLNIIKAAN